MKCFIQIDRLILEKLTSGQAFVMPYQLVENLKTILVSDLMMWSFAVDKDDLLLNILLYTDRCIILGEVIIL